MSHKPNREYTADTIEIARDLAQIRRKPAGFIGTKDVAGQIHMIREIVDNSVDELILRPEGGIIYIVLFRDQRRGRYQMLISDNGRGIPSASLMEATTVLGASGKTGKNSAYTASGGQFGIGGKVAAALSTRFRIISANYLENVVGSVYLENSEVREHYNENITIPFGVTTVFEPDLDPRFFVGGEEFMTSGYLDLIAICKQLNIFNENINFQFYILDRMLPERFWTASIQDAHDIIQATLKNQNITVEYNASAVTEKSAYLFELWKCSSALIFQDTYVKQPGSDQDRLGFNIRLYFSKKAATGNSQYFISINNVALPDTTGNSATTTFLQILRNQLIPYMESDMLKQFVAEEYRFPTMFLAIGIRYNGAELSGVTKTSFKDSIFAKQFASELGVIFGLKDEEYWKHFAHLLLPDIELRYSQFYDTPLKKSEGKKTFMDLNFPDNYKECKSSDPAVTELYLVEGTSAGNIIETRDNNFQAVYLTRGKPTNAATFLAHLAANRKVLLADPIYQDIMRILNIGPNTTDMSTARFGKIIIATDADPDGVHIRSIHLNNFYIINPRIIESGMVSLANPPLYSMNIGKNNKLFLRDKVALMDARVKFIYAPSLDIKIQTPAGVVELTLEAYRDLCYVINHIGEQFIIVAQQLNVPLLIQERLVLAIEHLFPTINYLELARYFESNDEQGYVRIRADEIGRFIVVSVGQEDFPIGLDAISETIVNHLLPILKKFMFKDLMFYVRSKHANSALKDWTPMSMMMLFIAMQNLHDMFNINRYKGLGEMDPPDCYETLMNKETRSLTHVTSIGNPSDNFALLGKDSSERKQLLTASGALSSLFVRNNS